MVARKRRAAPMPPRRCRRQRRPHGPAMLPVVRRRSAVE